MFEEEKTTPKFEEGDEVYVGNKLWSVHMVHAYGGSVQYDLVKDTGYFSDERKYKYSVQADEVHRLPLSERLARIESALGLE